MNSDYEKFRSIENGLSEVVLHGEIDVGDLSLYNNLMKQVDSLFANAIAKAVENLDHLPNLHPLNENIKTICILYTGMQNDFIFESRIRYSYEGNIYLVSIEEILRIKYARMPRASKSELRSSTVSLKHKFVFESIAKKIDMLKEVISIGSNETVDSILKTRLEEHLNMQIIVITRFGVEKIATVREILDSWTLSTVLRNEGYNEAQIKEIIDDYDAIVERLFSNKPLFLKSIYSFIQDRYSNSGTLGAKELLAKIKLKNILKEGISGNLMGVFLGLSNHIEKDELNKNKPVFYLQEFAEFFQMFMDAQSEAEEIDDKVEKLRLSQTTIEFTKKYHISHRALNKFKLRLFFKDMFKEAVRTAL